MGSVARMGWPARCLDCGLVTEDPDAYVFTSADEDGEYVPDHACPRTDQEHRWAPATPTPDPMREQLARALDDVFRPDVVPDEDRWMRLMRKDADRILAALGPDVFLVDVETVAEIARWGHDLRGDCSFRTWDRCPMRPYWLAEARRLLGGRE